MTVVKNKMAAQMETVINAYKTLAKVPSLVGAYLNKAGNRVASKWSIRNLDKGKSTKYVYSYNLSDKFKVLSNSDFAIDASNELLSSVSPSEKYRVVIREEKDIKDVKKQYLEIWQANTLASCVDLNVLDIHGDVYADGEFASLSWSPEEDRLLYIAEKKNIKSEPFISRKPAKDTPVTKGEEYKYRQDWGEQLVGKYLSVIVVFHLQDETFTVLEGLPESWCPGQVQFTPNGKGVVGVAWETEPRRLGLIFCTNRPGYVFLLDFDGNVTKISSEGLSVRSPRFNISGTKLVWLQRPSGGPHHSAHQIASTSWPLDLSVKPSILVDIIPKSIDIVENRTFTGMYALSLPKHCFTNDDKYLVFSTPQETEVRSFVLNIETKELEDISSTTFPGSTSVLDVKNNVVLASRSNMTTPAQLIVTRVGSNSEINWQAISEPFEVSAVKDTVVEYIQVDTEDDDVVKSFPVIYMGPEKCGDEKVPLIVWPHGGPHSGFVNAYSLEAALFRALGFASIQINYRGSTGQGQASVEFLPGKAGSTDVVDCKLSTEAICARYPTHKEQRFLFGGSHGGFLVTHLSGQYPDMFAAVVTRNPVIDVASMINSTDIADWCAVESGLEFNEQGPVSVEHLLKMRRCSPLAHVHKVKAPTAIMLGSGDKRVPFYQGLEYYRRLKANGCKAKIFMYEDNHSLSSLPAEMDNLINSASWFLEHMK